MVEKATFQIGYVMLWRTDENGDKATFLDLDYLGDGGTYCVKHQPTNCQTPKKAVAFVVEQKAGFPDIWQEVTKLDWDQTVPPPPPRGPAPQGLAAADTEPGPIPGSSARNVLQIEAVKFDPSSQQYRLVDSFGAIRDNVGLYNTVYVPDLFADTNHDGLMDDRDVLYSLVDLTIYLKSVPTFTLGQSFTIVDGLVAELPGMQFSTSPFVFDPIHGFTTTGLFSSGDAVVGQPGRSALAGSSDGESDSEHGLTAIPEPATWLSMLLGFGLLGWRLRWPLTRRSTVIPGAAAKA